MRRKVGRMGKKDMTCIIRPARGENLYLQREKERLFYRTEESLWGDLSPDAEINLQNILRGKL